MLAWIFKSAEFVEFRKIPRLIRDMQITEKIDGSNAQIYITGGKIYAGSRHRWIKPGKKTDNFGFAQWVEDNKEELMKLGNGRHFGEWYGAGIQRRYGLTEKRFALFNQKWADNPDRPACCEVVPVLYTGVFDSEMIEYQMRELTKYGSKAVPGFMKPEGIVITHLPSGHMYKKTFEGDKK